MDGTTTLTEREEIEALLPWYVTGRLDRADRARVDAYLGRHPEMRRQLAMIEDDRRTVIEANERIAVPRSLSADAVLNRLPRDAPGLLARLVGPLRTFFTAPTATGVQWAAAAVALAFVVQGVVIGTLSGPRPGTGYETASGGSQQASQSATVLVRFVAGASLDAIGEALARRDMRIIDGPKPGQLFVVAIGPKDLKAEERDKRVADLRGLSGLVALVLVDAGAPAK